MESINKELPTSQSTSSEATPSGSTHTDGLVATNGLNESAENVGHELDAMPSCSHSGTDAAVEASRRANDDTMKEAEWKPCSAAVGWVRDQMVSGVNPKAILAQMIGQDQEDIPFGDEDRDTLWRIVIELLTEPPRRKRLLQYNTLTDALELIRKSSNIIVLTGAGVSVSCGIPDFRSKDGIYARLHKDFPDLPNPQAMFDIDFFRRNPKPFYEFAKEIYPGQFKPSVTHYFIRLLEEHGKLLKNYTQNIDTLEDTAGITKVVQCHGSFSHATCCTCGYKTDSNVIRDDVMAGRIPRCPQCPPDAVFPVIKPDIVFFGESLPDHFHDSMTADRRHVDLLIVIGSSLRVRPVALIPSSIPPEVPQILINRDPLNHIELDIELLGNADAVVEELCYRLGPPYDTLVGWNIEKIMAWDEKRRKHMKLTTTKLEFCELETAQTAETQHTKINCSDSKTSAMRQVDELPPETDEQSRGQPTNQQVESQNEQPSVEQCTPCASTSAVTSSGPEKQEDLSTTLDAQAGEPLSKRSKVEEYSERAFVHTQSDETSVQPNASDTINETSLAELRAMYQPRMRSVSLSLPENSYYFMPPNRSVFPGAEVYMDRDQQPPTHDDNDTQSSSSSSSDESDVSDSDQERCQSACDLRRADDKPDDMSGTDRPASCDF